MTVKALKSFAGIETMYLGEVKDITNEEVLTDLLNAHYIELIETVKPKISNKKVKNNEN